MNQSSESINRNERTKSFVSQREKKCRTFKIIVIGDSNVGKTCLTFRFCGGQFPLCTEATIGVDFREKKLNIDGEDIVLQLWDTAGQERFRKTMVQHYYRNVSAVVFVYDITRLNSFENLSFWINECNNHQLSNDLPRILIGNKCDCKNRLEVSTSTAQMFADNHNMPLFETSAKNDSDCDHVNSIFLTLAHKLKASRPMMIVDPTNLTSNDLHIAEISSVERNSNDENQCYC